MKPYPAKLMQVAENLACLAAEMDMYDDIIAWQGSIHTGINVYNGREVIALQHSHDGLVFTLSYETGMDSTSLASH